MVYFNRDDASGTFLPPITMSSGSQPKNVVIGRFNADARLDAAVLVHGNSALQILFESSDGHFVQTYPFILVGSLVTGVISGDFIDDSRLDLIAPSAITSYAPGGLI